MSELRLKKTIKATYNYTGRRKIKSKYVNLSVLSQTEGELKLSLDVDTNIVDIDDNNLILEAIYSGAYSRRSVEIPNGNQIITLEGFPKNSNPSFRLKLIPKDQKDGKIFASTSIFKATRAKDDVLVQNNFLEFQKAELEGEIWSIDWVNGSPEIKLNKEFHELYDLNSDKHILIFILPSLLREIMTGIFIRNNEEPDENTKSYKWLEFCDTKLPNWSKPEEDEWEKKEHLLELVDNAVRTFCRLKWDGEKLLLDYLLRKRV